MIRDGGRSFRGLAEVSLALILKSVGTLLFDLEADFLSRCSLVPDNISPWWSSYGFPWLSNTVAILVCVSSLSCLHWDTFACRRIIEQHVT